MERSRFTSLSVAYVLVIGTIVGVPLALGPGTATAAAANHTVDAPYSIVQNGQCTPLWPRGNGSQTGSAYYDYQHPYPLPGTEEFSSYGTQDLQESEVSQLFVYDGSDGHSLVVIHDELGDDNTGGAATFEITGLPGEGTWTVEDDDYDTNETPQDDEFIHHNSTTSDMHWMWREGRTDGGVHDGLDGDDWEEITIDPAFAGDSWAATERNWPDASDGPTEWMVRDGTGDAISLDMDANVTIQKGLCGGTSPNATLNAPTPSVVGSNVTLNATGSTDPDGDIEEYWWSFDDGTDIATTQDGTVTHVYESNATYTPTVTVVDSNGSVDTASTTITVESDSPPSADFSVDDLTPDVDQPIEFNASNSTDDRGIANFTWAFGDGNGSGGETAAHAYSEPGDYTVTLTVTDAGGNTDTDDRTIQVGEQTEPLTANITVSDLTPTVGQSIELTATGSTADSTNATYAWDFGDGANATTTDQTISHVYDRTGEFNLTLTVTENNATATETETITVGEAREPLSADLSVQSEATPNESITLDASNSTGEIVEYNWTVDGEPLVGVNESRTNVTFDEPGDHEVTVTVVDDSSNESTANATITIAEDESSGGGSNNGGSGGSSGSSSAGSSGGGGSGGGGTSPAPGPNDERPRIVVANTSVDRDLVLAGETVTVTATVESSGDAGGTETLQLSVDGRIVDDRSVTLDAGESQQIAFSVRLDTTGDRTLRVDNSTATVTVDPREADIAVVDVWLEEETIQAGDRATIVTTVANDGGVAGRNTVTLTVFDEVVDRKTVEVPPGERRTVHFSQQFDSPGTYNIGIAGRQASVEVTGDSTATAFTMEEPNGTDRATSLGYIGIGGLVLAAAAIFASRRL